MRVAPRFQRRQHGGEGLTVCAEAVFHARRHLGIDGTLDDAVGFQGAKLRGERALRHGGQDAADFVEAQHAVGVQA